jgi:hypothetical protein
VGVVIMAIGKASQAITFAANLGHHPQHERKSVSDLSTSIKEKVFTHCREF